MSYVTNRPAEINDKLVVVFHKYFTKDPFKKVKLTEKKCKTKKKLKNLDSNYPAASKGYVSET
jgi:hypothetical protein